MTNHQFHSILADLGWRLTLVDPTQGEGSSWGYPVDLSVYGVHPALAALMAAIYRLKAT
jgi:hypothetical protein